MRIIVMVVEVVKIPATVVVVLLSLIRTSKESLRLRFSTEKEAEEYVRKRAEFLVTRGLVDLGFKHFVLCVLFWFLIYYLIFHV